MKNPTTVAIAPNWETAESNVIIIGSAIATSGYEQKLTIVGPYTDPQKKPASRTFKSSPQAGTGAQFCHFCDPVKYVQLQQQFYDVTIEYGNSTDGFKKSNILGTNDIGIADKAFSTFVLSNDGGKDSDFNDTYLTLTMFKNSND